MSVHTLASALATRPRPDVVVLGAGQAGLTAAVAAAQQGATVLVLEKLAYAGGSTSMSSGLTAYAGTDEQRELGIEDSVEALKADILATGQHRNDEALVDAYCREQLPPTAGSKASVSSTATSTRPRARASRARTPPTRAG